MVNGGETVVFDSHNGVTLIYGSIYDITFPFGNACRNQNGTKALGMMIPGMFVGYLADSWGFPLFFSFVCLCCLVTFIVSALVKVPEN